MRPLWTACKATEDEMIAILGNDAVVGKNNVPL